MGKRMSSAGFTFLPFGKASNKTTAAGRRLSDDTSVANQTQGMERYAQLIGVETDMLFYLTVAGVGALIVALFLVYGIVMAICYSFVDDFGAFSKKWLDKAIGVLMMILILSEYVIGVTATFQFCWCIDNNRVDASLFLAIFAVLVLAIGTIMYGFVVIKNHEDELRDLGTKDHFDKRVHARYGPLYDEYKFEGRYFFAPKLLLALLCGMTTGMVWLSGLWQIVVMIALHIAFLFYLEVKQPYPTQFVQKTSSFVIIIKISALFLSFFLISSATSFNADIPLDLREGVGFAIIGLQVLVLVCLMIRQVYIFYRTWKLKSQGEEEDKTPVITTTNNRDGTEQFFALGENRQDPHNNTAMLEEGSQHYQHQSQDHFKLQSEVGNQPGKLRNLQPSRRTHTVVVHETGPGAYRNNEVDL
uniref:TRP C-terminal domain-containing protein n=1 Tax=Globisporangium ultimum (strain ATCC 200006 / CBS 805.95 / DAOM BR144) TaxID=431595 RepID=K3XC35_GLOUD